MSEQTPQPKPGQPAPAVSGQITGDGRFDLADQLGTWVVLYFFPRANTPG